jgi:hypothetical protein
LHLRGGLRAKATDDDPMPAPAGPEADVDIVPQRAVDLRRAMPRRKRSLFVRESSFTRRRKLGRVGAEIDDLLAHQTLAKSANFA